MRFLCLHGFGTNSSILKTQLHALTRKLGSEHEYIYVDGEEQVGKARGLPEVATGPYLAWYKDCTSEAVAKALDLVDSVVEEDGPFDAVIGFSQGASVVISYLMQHEMEGSGDPPPFRFAMLFSPVTAISSDGTLYNELLRENKVFQELRNIDETRDYTVNGSHNDHRMNDLLDSIISTLQVGFEHGFIDSKSYESMVREEDFRMIPRVLVPSLIKQRIRIPVVHVLGMKDEPATRKQSESMKGFCTPGLLHCIKHKAGHDIPRGSEIAEVERGIEWAIDTSSRGLW